MHKNLKNQHILFLIVAFYLCHPFFHWSLCAAEEVKFISETPIAVPYDIAILNIDKLLHESKAAKGIQADLEGHRLKFQEEMKRHEENFIADEKILVEHQKTLKPEEFALKRKEFDAKVANVHQQATQKREEIERKFGQALEKIQETIFSLVRDMAVRHKYKLVVPRNFIIYQVDGLEITEEILKELDQKLPVIDLKFS